jgi:predicted RNase H-like HicB family nuclease
VSGDIRVLRQDDGTYYVEDLTRPGCWAIGPDEAAARAELIEVIEEWEQVRRTYA